VSRFPMIAKDRFRAKAKVDTSLFKVDPDFSMQPLVHGEVETQGKNLLSPGFKQLLQVAQISGYEPRECRLYQSCSHVVVNGSVSWHEDYSLGVVASTVIAAFDSNGDEVEVSSTTGELQLLTNTLKPFVVPGDVFIFDTSRGHAWISPFRCVLAQMTVKPIKNFTPQ
jgi:hypothetical protein